MNFKKLNGYIFGGERLPSKEPLEHHFEREP
jgi:hypothetical protein